jgi:hypothetical protein
MNGRRVYIQGEAAHPLVLGRQKIDGRADSGGLDPASRSIGS